MCSLRTATCCHDLEFVIDALTMEDHEPLRKTGKICLKSPPRTIGLPPNGRIVFAGLCSERMSRIVVSKASKQRRCVIGASSQIISDVTCKSSASIVPLFTLHVLASVMSNGILNLECVVRPFGKSREATPDDATASTIFFQILGSQL